MDGITARFFGEIGKELTCTIWCEQGLEEKDPTVILRAFEDEPAFLRG